MWEGGGGEISGKRRRNYTEEIAADMLLYSTRAVGTHAHQARGTQGGRD